MSYINTVSDYIGFYQGLDKSMKQKKSIDIRGFTLLEILIAMFIFVVVLSTIYTAYTGTFRNMEVTESQAEIYEMARITLERMMEDLESVYLPQRTKGSQSGDDTLQPTRFVGESTEIKGRRVANIRFVSRAHLVFNEEDKETGPAKIVYYVRESNEEEKGLSIYRSDTPVFEERAEGGGEERAKGLLLCDGLYSVNFTYYDDEGEAHDSWDTTENEYKDKLPRAVSILLEFVNKTNPESPLKFMTSVALPMARDTYEKAS